MDSVSTIEIIGDDKRIMSGKKDLFRTLILSQSGNKTVVCMYVCSMYVWTHTCLCIHERGAGGPSFVWVGVRGSINTFNIYTRI